MRFFAFLFLLLLSYLNSFSQLQLGIYGGIANYQGDLVDKLYKNSNGVFGLTVGYPITDRLNLRAGVSFTKLNGADSLSKQQDLILRNLSFQTSLTEFSLVGEYNTFDIDSKSWSPYLFAVLAVFHFNPYTLDQGNKVFLKPLSTEGQGVAGYPDSKPYALTQLALPFGAGVKYNISDRIRIALELGMRKLFTDYIDDVSGNYADPNDLFLAKGQQSVDLSYRGDEIPGGDPNYPVKGLTRGSPKNKDFYYFTGIHLVFNLSEGNGSRGASSKRGGKKGYGCPGNPM